MSKTVIDIFRFIISAVILPQLFKSESIPNTAAKPIQNLFKLNGNFHCTCYEDAGSQD